MQYIYKTVLYSACYSENIEVISLLLAHEGIDVNLKSIINYISDEITITICYFVLLLYF